MTTTLGLQIGVLLGGAVITETIFVLPGIGGLVVSSIFRARFSARSRRRAISLLRLPLCQFGRGCVVRLPRPAHSIWLGEDHGDPKTHSGIAFSRSVERGSWLEFFSRLVRARLAGVGLAIITVFACSALFAGSLSPYSPTKQRITNALQAPSAENWLGTDELGRDILSASCTAGAFLCRSELCLWGWRYSSALHLG